jgi:hypothetical protein
MHYAYNLSDSSISAFFNGKLHSIPSSYEYFEEVAEHLSQDEHDYDFLETHIDKPSRLARLSEGAVSVVGSTVYYAGSPVHTALALRLLNLLDAGRDATIWARFMDLVMKNPSPRSKECLYEFLNVWNAPLTQDGHFIAFKRVRGNYRDIHSGKFDNSPGKVVQVPRESVDPDPKSTCSYGLHVAASSYLDSYYATTDGYKVIACKVSPEDVVAVPGDYNFAKMRVCKYEVLGDAEESFVNNAHEVQSVTITATDEDTSVLTIEYELDCDLDIDLDVEFDTDLTDGWSEEDEFLSDIDEDDQLDDDDGMDEEDTGIIFTRNGEAYTSSAILNGVSQHGQRGYSRKTGIPRTTLQDWINRIEK